MILNRVTLAQVFETTDVYLWWRVKKALRNGNMTVYDCTVIGNRMYLEVAKKNEGIAKVIVKRVLNSKV